jgi:hypothetical protein
VHGGTPSGSVEATERAGAKEDSSGPDPLDNSITVSRVDSLPQKYGTS